MDTKGAIRDAVEAGDMHAAAQLIGRPLSIIGKVVHHKGRGRRLGFPTANVRIPYKSLIPRLGVYYAKILLRDGRRLPGLANIGNRPTFPEDQGETWLAVYIFDFDEDLHGQMIQVDFIAWIREERAFEGPEDLAFQIGSDVRRGRDIWARNL